MVVRLADLPLTQNVLSSYAFENCLVVGPAVLVPLSNTRFVDVGWNSPSAEASLWRMPTEGGPVVGAIGLVNVWFNDCTFEAIGMAVPDALYADTLANMMGDPLEPT